MSVRTWGEQPRYRIVRMFARRKAQTRGLPSDLTLAQAQAHCRDLNTSSSTAWKTSAIQRTRRYGAWFDGYEEMR
jgi:antitoxin component of RelBE/YafQ-DinJ toxin-antitoxin module